MTDDQVSVSLWQRDGTGWSKDRFGRTWSALDLEPRWNQPGTWQLSMPLDEHAARIQKSSGLLFEFRGQQLMFGLLEKVAPSWDERGGLRLEVSGVDASTLLFDALAWPDPASPLNSQTVARYRATGPVETVLTGLIRANLVDRRGDPVDVAGSQGRGDSITVNVRFKNVGEVVTSRADAAGLGVRMRLERSTAMRGRLVCEFLAGEDNTRFRLSGKARTLRTWSQSDMIPGAMRAIVAGKGKGVNRVFRQPADSLVADEWGRMREAYIDARDEGDAAALVERGREVLAEAAEASTFELETADAPGMRMFEHAQIGDVVTIKPLPDVEGRRERIRAVKITVGRGGTTLQVVPGNPDASDPLFRQAVLLQDARRRLKALEQGDDDEEML